MIDKGFLLLVVSTSYKPYQYYISAIRIKVAVRIERILWSGFSWYVNITLIWYFVLKLLDYLFLCHNYVITRLRTFPGIKMAGNVSHVNIWFDKHFLVSRWLEMSVMSTFGLINIFWCQYGWKCQSCQHLV